LYLSKIKLYNFRNLSDQSIELSNGPIYITGLNGNGKTNFVEAIYLLSGSRSFRTNNQGELIKWGNKEASVFGVVNSKNGNSELGIALTPGKRRAFRDGAELQSIAQLLGGCSVVAFAPSDLTLVKGAPAGRRRFLDRHVVDIQPHYLKLLLSYQRALDSKSALLKRGIVSAGDLEPWNRLLAEYGGKLVDNRRKFLILLEQVSRKVHREFALTDGELSLNLESDLLPHGDTDNVSPVSENWVYNELVQVSQREIQQRSCIFGPHRDDIAITLRNGSSQAIDARAYASQGQTRSIVLALKLGVIELLESECAGESPIVILDDVDSELDRERSERLFSLIGSERRQIFITGTELPEGHKESEVLGRCRELIVSEGVVSV
jgi:DNA replication and repair protein RecF